LGSGFEVFKPANLQDSSAVETSNFVFGTLLI